MPSCFLLLGSNLGNRLQNIQTALEQIQSRVGDLLKKSALYCTAPWGMISKYDFYNVVVEINIYSDNPKEVLKKLQAIENSFGIPKIRSESYQDRHIDIDILYFGNQIISEEDLQIPHLRIRERRFVLVPLVEIAADLVHPIFKKSQQELLEACTDNLEVIKQQDL